jgi:hypothetical protein
MFKFIKNIWNWLEEQDRKERLKYYKRLDDREEKFCNDAYAWLFRNF